MKLEQAAKLKRTVSQCVDNSNRLQALEKLCGYYQNGTAETVCITQDDATRTVFIKLGSKTVAEGATLHQALDSLILSQVNDED